VLALGDQLLKVRLPQRRRISCVCVHFNGINQWNDSYEIWWASCHWRQSQWHIYQLTKTSMHNNMADVRTCEVDAALELLDTCISIIETKNGVKMLMTSMQEVFWVMTPWSWVPLLPACSVNGILSKTKYRGQYVPLKRPWASITSQLIVNFKNERVYVSMYSDNPGSIPCKIYLFCRASRPTLGPAHIPIQWVLEVPSPR
jgi:hypothetical protein